MWNGNFSINEIADLVGGKKIYVDPRPAEVRETLFFSIPNTAPTIEVPSTKLVPNAPSTHRHDKSQTDPGLSES